MNYWPKYHPLVYCHINKKSTSLYLPPTWIYKEDPTQRGADLVPDCYGTASCLISSHLINHASPILSNELFNTYLISVWLLWNSSLFNLWHFIIVWSCGHCYKVWQLLGITSHCWLNAKPLLHTAYTQTLFLSSQTIFLLSYFLICSFFHTLSSYLWLIW